MAKSKFTFEKRQREKAKRLKQIEKASKRMMAKQQKTHALSGKDSDAADPVSGSPSVDEMSDNAGRDEGSL